MPRGSPNETKRARAGRTAILMVSAPPLHILDVRGRRSSLTAKQENKRKSVVKRSFSNGIRPSLVYPRRKGALISVQRKEMNTQAKNSYSNHVTTRMRQNECPRVTKSSFGGHTTSERSSRPHLHLLVRPEISQECNGGILAHGQMITLWHCHSDGIHPCSPYTQGCQ